MTTTEPTADDFLGALINVWDDLDSIIRSDYGRAYEVKKDLRPVLHDVRQILKRAGIDRD
jgi:hypothetical protein